MGRQNIFSPVWSLKYLIQDGMGCFALQSKLRECLQIEFSVHKNHYDVEQEQNLRQ